MTSGRKYPPFQRHLLDRTAQGLDDPRSRLVVKAFQTLKRWRKGSCADVLSLPISSRRCAVLTASPTNVWFIQPGAPVGSSSTIYELAATSVTVVTPPAMLRPTCPSTEMGCSENARPVPPVSTFAPSPTPSCGLSAEAGIGSRQRAPGQPRRRGDDAPDKMSRRDFAKGNTELVDLAGISIDGSASVRREGAAKGLFLDDEQADAGRDIAGECPDPDGGLRKSGCRRREEGGTQGKRGNVQFVCNDHDRRSMFTGLVVDGEGSAIAGFAVVTGCSIRRGSNRRSTCLRCDRMRLRLHQPAPSA